MQTFRVDFNDVLSEVLGGLPEGGIATKEIEIAKDNKIYRLIALSQDGNIRLALWDESGDIAPGFKVDCLGERIRLEEGAESLDLGERSCVELSALELYLGAEQLGRLQIIPEPRRFTEDERMAAIVLRTAWRTVHRLRTCPPLEELRRGGPEAARHIESCSDCREAIKGKDTDRAWQSLLNSLAAVLPAPQCPRIEPGQVWSLVEEMDGWDEEEGYLKAPQVLVLSANGGIKAVPCCPEPLLADEADVVLSDQYGFAEAWNTHELPASVFRECWGSVEPTILQEVRDKEHSVAATPTPWRRAFVRLESRLTRVCQERALLLDEARKRNLSLAEVRSWFGKIQEGFLKLFRGPIIEPGLALAADGLNRVPASLRRAGGELEDIEVTITGWSSREDGLHVEGRMRLPEGAAPTLLMAWLQAGEDEMLEAVETDVAEANFSAKFPSMEDASPGNLRLLLVDYNG